MGNDFEMGIVTNLDGSTPEASLDPMNRPMEKAPTIVEQKPRKMRKGYFVAMLFSILVAAACAAVALLLIFTGDRTDAVAKAVQKIVNGETAENLAVEGTIKLVPSTETGIAEIKIKISSAIITKSLINTTNATVEITAVDGEKSSIGINEMYASTGDLYLKLDGLADAPELLQMLTLADSTWVRIPLETLPVEEESEYTCLANLAGDLKNSKNSIKELYADYSFATGTNKEIQVASKGNPVYRVDVEDENFVAFINGANKLSPVKNFLGCTGETEAELDGDKMLDAVKSGPEIYVEIDENYNFTRIYSKFEIESGTVEIDLDLSYPQNVNVSEPLEYVDLEKLLLPEEPQITEEEIYDI